MTFAMSPVGSVRSARRDPANSDHWGQVTSAIVIDERFGGNCLAGLAEFSHVEVLFVFDQARERDDYLQPRSPRGRADLPAVGVFADRGPRRCGTTSAPEPPGRERPELSVAGGSVRKREPDRPPLCPG
jgi:tRNA (adenine37-N6)-methyltransferase